MVRIAVDGMGGDFAPQAIVKGAEQALKEKVAEIILVGDKARLVPFLENPDEIEIVHTDEYVEMTASPSAALRKKRGSSVNKSFELVRTGKAQGVVTAGNSGAAMAFAIFTLGRIGLVERPAIATLHPNVSKGTITVVLDGGGNVDCRPVHLVQFAIMGSAFAKSAFGIEMPRVGLLSNAEEETKGNDLTREAHAMIKELGLNYLGYVEGNHVHNGRVDVVVCDGFVGNIALKITEGVAESLMAFLRERIEKSLKNKMGYLLMKEIFDELAKKTDYSEYGGAPLLGVDGVCIICHGRSNERAIKSAISMAAGFVRKNLNESIKETMIDHFRG
ncbi:MAG TPA: phosphate acyltransferase PlsX [Syntrophorhabdus sp.]|jgi:glycerol-3-phosphate acyltransferase PlsX|nr:phosphate acyltransferase PlsX [Syntrophorhabdus sp.]MDI9559521.1 phosphate acyltransferase PlsX [Pseudomonadota bacterium]OPX97147.1 MAG: Phosphate acyltransferase [Syntrophorhabdus sp. PtaB.Bin027]OQB75777.1 MAG: Phosphate acyltransferase [Deltaproteobacteria bacterium ADurb.Bin135]MBP8744956.1 phosphate acyltransferase PlsX [Syntrophorhabdus sp.]